MNLEEFRIAHSTLMEHYQFVERELEGIYAALSGKPFYFGLMDVEKFGISKLNELFGDDFCFGKRKIYCYHFRILRL